MVEMSFLTCQHAMAVPKPTIKGRVYACGKRMIVALCLGFWVVVYFPKLCLAFSLTWLLSLRPSGVCCFICLGLTFMCQEPWELDSIWSIR